jgi:hypothetical protein
MNKILLLSAIIIVITAFRITEPTSRKVHRVKQVFSYKGKDTTTYVYNADGHIAYVKNTNGDKSDYEYSDSIIIKRYYDSFRKVAFADTMALNKKGLVEKVTSNNFSTIEIREYNDDKYLIKTTVSNKEGKKIYYGEYQYLNGNEISSTTTGVSGDLGGTATYQYYTDMPNTIGVDNMGSDFVGASSNNPRKYFNNQAVGLEPYTRNYNYHYDEKGRIIIKASYDGKSGKLTDSTYYTYY